MALIPWIERHPLSELRTDIDTIFDQFFGQASGREIEPWGAFTFRSLAVDMEETENEILVKAEMPGLEPKDFQISVNGDTLTIKGEKKAEKTEEKKNYHMIERRYGSFHRSIPLPSEVDNDKVKASYSKGILEILLPKSKQHKAKRITVNVK